jgi:hypothetical protein
LATRRFYSDKNDINSFIKQLKLVEKLDDGWVEKYIDNSSGIEWLKYQTNSEYHGGGHANLMRLPEPTTTELIDIAINSEFDDEALAAANRLCDNEKFENKEFRQKLIEKLKAKGIQKLTEKEKSRLKMVITSSNLDQPGNRKEIVGKSIKEIEGDSQFFQMISIEAISILKNL